MSTYVKAFLETEITGIPQIMERYIGKYYNNALYNGITWMVFILHIIHFAFDLSVNALLRKMRFKEYVRIRLKRSLWYLGFYGCCFLYCSATMWKNDIKLPHRHKFHVVDLTEPVSGHLILGFALLSAFYASSSMWEGLQCSASSFTYLFLTGFVGFTYFLRYIELSILLASTFSVIHVMVELTRCLFCIIKGDLGLPKLLVKFAFFVSVVTFTITYFVIIPASFILPIGRGLAKNPNSVIMAGLNITIWGWLVCEIYTSPLYRLIQHRWHHNMKGNKVPECMGSAVECALFLPRDDVAYNLKIIRQEIKERQAKMMALRKPKKGTSMLLQTLKCVAAINRKIKYKKLMERETAHADNNDFLSSTPWGTITDKASNPDDSGSDNESSGSREDDQEATEFEGEIQEDADENEDLSNTDEKIDVLYVEKNQPNLKVKFMGIIEEDKEGQIEPNEETAESVEDPKVAQN